MLKTNELHTFKGWILFFCELYLNKAVFFFLISKAETIVNDQTYLKRKQKNLTI